MGRSDAPDWQESAGLIMNAINELSAHVEDGHVEFAKEKISVISFHTDIICGTISRYEKPNTDVNIEHMRNLQRSVKRKREQIEILESKVSVLLASNQGLGNTLAQYAEKAEKVKDVARSTSKLTRLVKGNRNGN